MIRSDGSGLRAEGGWLRRKRNREMRERERKRKRRGWVGNHRG
jgi:hypothetical protein